MRENPDSTAAVRTCCRTATMSALLTMGSGSPLIIVMRS
jgi:hypothetical protein